RTGFELVADLRIEHLFTPDRAVVFAARSEGVDVTAVGRTVAFADAGRETAAFVVDRGARDFLRKARNGGAAGTGAVRLDIAVVVSAADDQAEAAQRRRDEFARQRQRDFRALDRAA